MEIIFNNEKYIASSDLIKNIDHRCNKSCHKKGDGYAERICTECSSKYIAYYSSRAKLCCTCRSIKNNIKRSVGVFKVNKGYPKKEAFTSTTKLNNYFKGEKIICLLCGNDFSMLNQHLNAAHETTAEEYRLQFGLPFSRGLTGTVVRNKQIEIGYKNVNAMGIDACVKRLKNPTGIRRDFKHAPALKKKQAKNSGEGAKKSSKHISKRKNLVKAFCSDCGGEIERKVAECVVITSACKILCRNCKNNHHAIQQQKWADKKGINLKEYKKEISKKHYAKKKYNARIS